MMSGALYLKGNCMEQNKIVGYMVVAIFAYYVLSVIFPFLIVGVIGWVGFKAFEEYSKRKK